MLRDAIPTVSNEIKFPGFMRFYTNYEVKFKKCQMFVGEQNEYKYYKKPPSLHEILKTSEKPKKMLRHLESIGREADNELFDEVTHSFKSARNDGEKQKALDLDKKLRQKCSIADLAVLGFEIFARSRPNLSANPEIDGINALIFHLTNERVKFSDYYKTKKGLLSIIFVVRLWFLVTGVILVDEIEYKNLKDIKDKVKIFYSFPFVLIIKAKSY